MSNPSNLSRAQKGRATRLRNAESKARMAEEQARVQAIVASGCCPKCGAGLVRNWALTGWWQCGQYGAVGFRKDNSKPACSWQGFTA